MTEQMEIDKPNRVTISYDEGMVKIVVLKRDDSTDEDLSYTFITNAGPVNYTFERHGTDRTTRM